MTPEQRAYVAGVKVADVLLAHGLPVVRVEAMDAGSQFAIAFAKPSGATAAMRWPVDASVEAVEADVRQALELTR